MLAEITDNGFEKNVKRTGYSFVIVFSSSRKNNL